MAVETLPRDLDPRFATDASSVHALELILNALYRIDEAGSPVPDLAARDWLESATRLRVELRSDARFHDGTPLRSRDVLATFRSVLDPNTGSPFRNELLPIRDVRTDGDLAVIFELDRPFAPILYKLASVNILQARQARDPEPLETPVGTGPYRLAERVPGGHLLLEAHRGYHNEQPRSPRLLLRAVPNAATRLLELSKGSVHLVINGLPPNLVDALERRGEARVLKGPGSSTSYLGLNLEHPALSDRRVRRAMAHALDRRAIVETLLGGHATLAAALLPPRHWARPPHGPGPSYDPALARSLLDQAGYPDPPGPEPRLRLSYKTSTDRLRVRIGEVLAAQLAQVGIQLELRSLEWGTFYADVKSGNFHTYTLKWIGLFDPDIFFYVFHSSSVPPAGANRGRYSNADLDRWIEASRTEPDPERRRQLFARIERTLAEDLPYVFLWHEQDIAAMSPDLEGFRMRPGGSLRGVTGATLGRGRP